MLIRPNLTKNTLALISKESHQLTKTIMAEPVDHNDKKDKLIVY